MRNRIGEDPSISNKEGWEDLWEEGITPWDIGMPTPVLKAEIESTKWPTKIDSFRILIPGCGSGFDLVTMAKHLEELMRKGHVRDSLIVGLDISPSSLERAQEVLTTETTRFTTLSNQTCIMLALGDFFDHRSWKAVYTSNSSKEGAVNLSSNEGTFDFIFDYVFFCALPPELRQAWGTAMCSLLKPQRGKLLTVLFPVTAEKGTLDGPPYAVDLDDYRNVLEPRGVLLESGPYESHHTIPPRKGKEMVCWWRRGKDPVSSL